MQITELYADRIAQLHEQGLSLQVQWEQGFLDASIVLEEVNLEMAELSAIKEWYTSTVESVKRMANGENGDGRPGFVVAFERYGAPVITDSPSAGSLLSQVGGHEDPEFQLSQWLKLLVQNELLTPAQAESVDVEKPQNAELRKIRDRESAEVETAKKTRDRLLVKVEENAVSQDKKPEYARADALAIWNKGKLGLSSGGVAEFAGLLARSKLLPQTYRVLRTVSDVLRILGG